MSLCRGLYFEPFLKQLILCLHGKWLHMPHYFIEYAACTPPNKKQFPCLSAVSQWKTDVTLRWIISSFSLSVDVFRDASCTVLLFLCKFRVSIREWWLIVTDRVGGLFNSLFKSSQMLEFIGASEILFFWLNLSANLNQAPQLLK